MAATVQHTCDEIFKGSAYMSDVLTDPIMGHSEDPDHAPLVVCHCFRRRNSELTVSLGRVEDKQTFLGMD
jgi:hypothetical protein